MIASIIPFAKLKGKLKITRDFNSVSEAGISALYISIITGIGIP
jgi:hypothetical protein